MGIPQNPTTSETPSAAPPTASTSLPESVTSSVPPNPTNIPPAVLDLAHKLFDLCRAGETPLLTQYLTAGVSPNLRNHKGDSLVMLAAYHGHTETVKTLIERGADVNVLNDRGQSPIAGAVFKGFEEVVRCLWKDGGADLQAGEPNAVQTARMFKREELLREWGVESES